MMRVVLGKLKPIVKPPLDSCQPFVNCIADTPFNLPEYVLLINDAAYILTVSDGHLSVPVIPVAAIPPGTTIGHIMKIDDVECTLAIDETLSPLQQPFRLADINTGPHLTTSECNELINLLNSFRRTFATNLCELGYWFTGIRRYVKTHIRRCFICYTRKGQSGHT